jgi:hypothetical protein
MRDPDARPPKTKLGQAAAQATKAEPSAFIKAAHAARVLEPFTIPRLNLKAVMTLVPHYRANVIESEVIAEMERLKIPNDETHEIQEWEAERAARYLAEAALDPDLVAKQEYVPVGELADWRALDRDVLGECWRIYCDVRAAYDPISQELTAEEMDMIEAALKKKAEDADLCLRFLRLFGIRRLSRYLLASAERLSTSATPTSSDTPSSPA